MAISDALSSPKHLIKTLISAVESGNKDVAEQIKNNLIAQCETMANKEVKLVVRAFIRKLYDSKSETLKKDMAKLFLMDMMEPIKNADRFLALWAIWNSVSKYYDYDQSAFTEEMSKMLGV